MNYNLIKIVTGFIIFLTSPLVFAENFSSYYNKFLIAEKPNLNEIQEGWFSGRCFARRDPTTMKSGLLVFIKSTNQSGFEFKQIIPAASIREEFDYFDELDEEEFSIYSQELYERNNSAAVMGDNSLISDLHYDILIGTLHTRKSGNDYWVTLTNYQDKPSTEEQSYFVCMVNKKVH